jgi:hypothetical protein
MRMVIVETVIIRARKEPAIALGIRAAAVALHALPGVTVRSRVWRMEVEGEIVSHGVTFRGKDNTSSRTDLFGRWLILVMLCLWG